MAATNGVRALTTLSTAALVLTCAVPTATAHGGGGSAPPANAPKVPTSIGTGGAATSVDPNVTAIGRDVLKRGGNAVDAAVAMGAALGVAEPYSAGIGGGGYFVYYNAKTGKVSTIDGRETAPMKMPTNAFVDPATGKPYNFTPELVTSGVSVGVPGTPATWDTALRKWGTMNLQQALAPATSLARNGFVVDNTFRSQTLDNKLRFSAFTSTSKLYLPGGDAPAVGSVFKNPDLANTYDLLSRKGTKAFYGGGVAQDIVKSVQAPPKTDTTSLPVPAGYMTTSDLARYVALVQKPAATTYRGYKVVGMAPSSSGISTVGEALNIMEHADLPKQDDANALHQYLEASALAFADRGKYVGDDAFVDVPLDTLLSKKFAASRACLINPTTAMTKPVAAGPLTGSSCAGQSGKTAPDTENINTTNLTVADKWGNVVEYTLTIEQTGGSGIVVPGRGFLLNNELTDFTNAYDPADPNRLAPGKRPRSSMSPTIVFKDGKPFLALGSPGGATIITTVLQMLFNRIDRGMTIQQAIAAPRASQRNTATTSAEPAFIDKYGAALAPFGQKLTPTGDSFTSASEIGAATAIEFGPNGSLIAVSEPVRRGGGSALVVNPSK